MSNVRREVGEEGEAGNRFQRLPDDVVLHILSKISNVKWLCRCFIVVKRFASLIPLVQKVSFDAKTWNLFSFLSNEEGPGYVEGRSFERIFSEYPLLYHPQLRFPHLVFHLKHIQHLNIELRSIDDANNTSVFTLGANFTRNLGHFTFLTAASLSKTDDKKGGLETENEVLDHSVREILRVDLALDCVEEAVLCIVTLASAVKICSMLQSVTITDLKNQGLKLCLSGEKLEEYRKKLKIVEHMKTLKVTTRKNFKILIARTMRIRYIPVLQLPVSGYVMKGVTLAHINPFGIDAFDGTTMVDVFAEEESVFSEAVVHIVEKHSGWI